MSRVSSVIGVVLTAGAFIGAAVPPAAAEHSVPSPYAEEPERYPPMVPHEAPYMPAVPPVLPPDGPECFPWGAGWLCLYERSA